MVTRRPDAIPMHTKELGRPLSQPVGDQSSRTATARSDLLVATEFFIAAKHCKAQTKFHIAPSDLSEENRAVGDTVRSIAMTANLRIR